MALESVIQRSRVKIRNLLTQRFDEVPKVIGCLDVQIDVDE
jgi:hypothetical protein